MSTQEFVAYSGKMLDIELSTGRVEEFPIPQEWYHQFLGGKGLAIRLLLDILPQGIDPLGDENIMVFSAGLLNASGAPSSSRYNLSTKSPLTGGIGSSNCGGNFGWFLRKAGYDGMIIRGKAKQPVFIDIINDDVQIKDARHLWGLEVPKTIKRINKKHTGYVCIGPAGEHLVRYACIMDGHRALGRTGVGAVMGSKLLKAVRASGNHVYQAAKPAEFKRAIREFTTALQEHPITGKQLKKYGTGANANPLNAYYAAAVRNFSKGHDECIEQVSGESFTEEMGATDVGCRSCPMRCGRSLTIDGKKQKGPEFETMGLFGPNIENYDKQVIVDLSQRCDDLGLDTISAAGTIAFAMDLQARGVYDTGLEFGKTDGLVQTIDDIAYRQDFGAELAEGSMRMAQKFGGGEFAYHSKGLEIAAYNPRGAIGQGLGFATANRGGCHLDAGFVILFEIFGSLQIDPLSSKGKHALNVLAQDVLAMISASGFCVFTPYTMSLNTNSKYIGSSSRLDKLVSKLFLASSPFLQKVLDNPEVLVPVHLPVLLQSKVLSAWLGENVTFGKYLRKGERIFNLERLFILREGLSQHDDELPEEAKSIPLRPQDNRSKVPLEQMLPLYYKARGWDGHGVPLAARLKKIGLKEFTKLAENIRKHTDGWDRKQGRAAQEYDDALDEYFTQLEKISEQLINLHNELHKEFLLLERKAYAKQVRQSEFVVDEQACQACGLCFKACPHDAIVWSEGEPAYIDQEKCIRCGSCFAACPNHFQAVKMEPALPNTLPRPQYEVDKSACAKCGICFRKCPRYAISWKKGEVAIINQELCVSCGLCHEVCPDKYSAVLKTS